MHSPWPAEPARRGDRAAVGGGAFRSGHNARREARGSEAAGGGDWDLQSHRHGAVRAMKYGSRRAQRCAKCMRDRWKVHRRLPPKQSREERSESLSISVGRCWIKDNRLQSRRGELWQTSALRAAVRVASAADQARSLSRSELSSRLRAAVTGVPHMTKQRMGWGCTQWYRLGSVGYSPPRFSAPQRSNE